MVRRSTKDPEPWVPFELQVFPVGRRATIDRADGKQRPCWDVRWRVDGRDFMRRFPRSADANAWATDLRLGQREELPFDPVAKRFVQPITDEPSTGVTLLRWTEIYWDRKWPQLEPKSRKELSRHLNRARRYFVTAPIPEETVVDVDDYLLHASLCVQPVEATGPQQAGEQWLEAHSRPLASIGREDLESFLAHYRRRADDPKRQVSPATERRMIADLRQCWARAAHEDRIASNPWDRLEQHDRAGRRASSRGNGRLAAADAEMVLSPSQVFQLAETCGELGGWGNVVVCFVLVMGLCGLRPSEALGLTVGDVELPDAGNGWLTVRRSRRKVEDRFLDPEDDPAWGPLKGRELTASRRVPIPTEVVDELRSHLKEFCDGASAHHLLFHRNGRGFDLDAFDKDVWKPARAVVFPKSEDLEANSTLQPKLSRLRRHDLRHSACSLWLRSRVDVSVCQKWSGHKQLSVFLDIYQGLIPGREEEGARLLDERVAAELASD